MECLVKMEEFGKRFEKLYNGLTSFLINGGGTSQERALINQFHECMTFSSSLLAIGNVPNSKDRIRLQEDHTRIVGDTDASVSEQFAHETLLLSTALDVNENFAASLLAAAASEQTRYEQPPVIVSLFLYYNERSFQIELYSLILREAANVPLAGKMQSWMLDHLADSKQSLILRLLDSFRSLETLLNDSLRKLDGKIASTVFQREKHPTRTADSQSQNGSTAQSHSAGTLARDAFVKQLSELQRSLEQKIVNFLLEIAVCEYPATVDDVLATVNLASDFTIPEKNSRPPLSSYLVVISLALLNPYRPTPVLAEKASEDSLVTAAKKLTPKGVSSVYEFFILCRQHSSAERLEQRTNSRPQSFRSFLEEFSKSPFGEMHSLLEDVLNSSPVTLTEDTKAPLPSTAATAGTSREAANRLVIFFFQQFLSDCLSKTVGLFDFFRYTPRVTASEELGSGDQDLSDVLDICTLVFKSDGAQFWRNNSLVELLKLASEKQPFTLLFKSWKLVSSLLTSDDAAQEATTKFFNALPVSQSGSRSSKVSWEFLMKLASDLAASPATQWKESDCLTLQEGLLALKNLVENSDIERIRLFDRQTYRAGDRLLSLLLQPLSVQLKASIMDTLASFALPTKETGSEMAESIWQFFVLNPGTLGQPSAQNGLVYDLEQIESSWGFYPATCAYLNLVSRLVAALTVGQSMAMMPWTPSETAEVSRPWHSCVQFLLEYLLPSLHQRPFINAQARWTFCEAVFETLLAMLRGYWHIVAFQKIGPGVCQNPGFLVFEGLLGTTGNSRLAWYQLNSVLTIGVDMVNHAPSDSRLVKCVAKCIQISQLLAQLGFVHAEVQEKLQIWLNGYLESGTDLLSAKTSSKAAFAASEMVAVLQRAISQRIHGVDKLFASEPNMIGQLLSLLDCLSPVGHVPELVLSLLSVLLELPGTAPHLVSLLSKSSESRRILSTVAFRLEQAAYDSQFTAKVVNRKIQGISSRRIRAISETLNQMDGFDTVLPMQIDYAPRIVLLSPGDRPARRIALAIVELALKSPADMGMYLFGILSSVDDEEHLERSFAGFQVLLQCLFDDDFRANDPVLAVYYWQLLAKFLTVPKLQADIFAAIKSQSENFSGGLSCLVPKMLSLVFIQGVENQRNLAWYLLETAYVLQCVQQELLFLAQDGYLGRLSELIATLFPTSANAVQSDYTLLDLYHWLVALEVRPDSVEHADPFSQSVDLILNMKLSEKDLRDEVLKLKQRNCKLQQGFAREKLWKAWVTVTDLCLYSPGVLSNMSTDEVYRLSTGLLPVLLEQLDKGDARYNIPVSQMLGQVIFLDKAAAPKVWTQQCLDWAIRVLISKDSVLALRGWTYVVFLSLADVHAPHYNEQWLAVIVGDALEASLPWRLLALSALANLLCRAKYNLRKELVGYLVQVNALLTLLHNLDRDIQMISLGASGSVDVSGVALDQTLAIRLVQASFELVSAVLSVPEICLDRFAEFILLSKVDQFKELRAALLSCALAAGQQFLLSRRFDFYVRFLVTHSNSLTTELLNPLPFLVVQETFPSGSATIETTTSVFPFLRQIYVLTMLLRMVRAIVSTFPQPKYDAEEVRKLVTVLTRRGDGWHALFNAAAMWMASCDRWLALLELKYLGACAASEGYLDTQRYTDVLMEKCDNFLKLFLLYRPAYQSWLLERNSQEQKHCEASQVSPAFFSNFKFADVGSAAPLLGKKKSWEDSSVRHVKMKTTPIDSEELLLLQKVRSKLLV